MSLSVKNAFALPLLLLSKMGAFDAGVRGCIGFGGSAGNFTGLSEYVLDVDVDKFDDDDDDEGDEASVIDTDDGDVDGLSGADGDDDDDDAESEEGHTGEMGTGESAEALPTPSNNASLPFETPSSSSMRLASGVKPPGCDTSSESPDDIDDTERIEIGGDGVVGFAFVRVDTTVGKPFKIAQSI